MRKICSYGSVGAPARKRRRYPEIINSLAPGKAQEQGRRKLKLLERTQRVTNPARKRLATSRKRVLRSRPERAARSVDSECRSRVIEPRKVICRGSPWRENVRGQHRGAETRRGAEGRPGSENRAKAYRGSLGTWERTVVPWDHRPEWGATGYQRPGTGTADWPVLASERDQSTQGHRGQRRTSGASGGQRGRLSRLIVPQQSRRRSPVRAGE